MSVYLMRYHLAQNNEIVPNKDFYISLANDAEAKQYIDVLNKSRDKPTDYWTYQLVNFNISYE